MSDLNVRGVRKVRKVRRVRGVRARVWIFTLIVLACASPHRLSAQTLAGVASPPAVGSGANADALDGALHLLVGRSAVLDVEHSIARVSLSRPEVADALITSPRELLVHGKTPGTISLLVWERNGALRRYEVRVQRDLSLLAQQMQRLFPGEPIAVTGSGRHVVISGTVSSKYVVEKAAEVAAGYVEKSDDVVNLLRQAEGVAANQVLLRVRFAEVSRNALTELGASFFTGPGGFKDYVGRSTTEQFPAPDFDTERGGLVFSDFLNFLVLNTEHQVGTLVRALQAKGLFQTLAEPNLVAENGKEASFLAGGEYPYPVAQSTGANLAIAIHFKEFGIKLSFTPTIVGSDLVHLKVRPEVSSLDFANAVSLEGFRVPALTTRRTETEIELRDGQTFAIAGLLNNTVTSSLQKVPGIGDIPILGLLFRSKAAQKAQTELVVLITPQILRRDSPGAAEGLPHLVEPYLPPLAKPMPPPPPQMPGSSVKPPQSPARPQALKEPQTPNDQKPEDNANAAVTEDLAPTSTSDWPPLVVSPPPLRGLDLAPAAPAVQSEAAQPDGGNQIGAPSGRAEAQSDSESSSRRKFDLPAQAGSHREAPDEPGSRGVRADVVEVHPGPPSNARVADSDHLDVGKRLEARRRQREAEIEALSAERKRAARQQKLQKKQESEARRAAAKASEKQEELARAEAKRAAERARKEAELARKRQEVLGEAEARFKEAEAAYRAALDRASKPGPPQR